MRVEPPRLFSIRDERHLHLDLNRLTATLAILGITIAGRHLLRGA
jgi:hypothetical protein